MTAAGEQARPFVLADAEQRLLKRLEVGGGERLVVPEALDGNLVLMAAQVVLDLFGVLVARLAVALIDRAMRFIDDDQIEVTDAETGGAAVGHVLLRKASAASRIAAMRFCSARGGTMTSNCFSLPTLMPGKKFLRLDGKTDVDLFDAPERNAFFPKLILVQLSSKGTTPNVIGVGA